MFDRLRKLLAPAAADQPAPGRHSFEERQLAAAALLVEAARLDSAFGEPERVLIDGLLRDRFALTAEEAADLVAEAEAVSAESVQIQGFTRAVKDGFDYDERVQLIEMLWEVAYADGTLHDYEANLLRRVTGLLYVADRDTGEARRRVLARLGLA